MCCVVLLVAWVAAVAAPELPRTGGAQNEQVIIRDRLSPAGLVVSVAGSCGKNRYQIVLTNDGHQNRLRLEVNGRQVAAPEIAKVMKLVPPGDFLFDPFVAECFWDRPNARMRLMSAGPARHGREQWLSFEVTPAGEVMNVRPN
jgi:hypothetical protein